MADAMADGLPLVVFSGQVPTTAIGTDAFQEGKNNSSNTLLFNRLNTFFLY